MNFDLDSKIHCNRERIKQIKEDYNRISNYGIICIAYLYAVALYFFDFIKYFFRSGEFSHQKTVFLIVFCFFIVSLAVCLYLMISVFALSDYEEEAPPKIIYRIAMDEAKQKKPEATDEQLEQWVKEYLLEKLEHIAAHNFELYKNKKNKLALLIKYIGLSIFIYAINIIFYISFSL